LPSPPLPASVAERVHTRARAAFVDGHAGAARRVAAFAAAAAVVSACAVYVAWAVRFLSALAEG
jgi:hypothetical protein